MRVSLYPQVMNDSHERYDSERDEDGFLGKEPSTMSKEGLRARIQQSNMGECVQE